MCLDAEKDMHISTEPTDASIQLLDTITCICRKAVEQCTAFAAHRACSGHALVALAEKVSSTSGGERIF